MTPLRTHEGTELGGDGTVSRISAIPIEDEDTSATYFATTHIRPAERARSPRTLEGRENRRRHRPSQFSLGQGVGAPIRLAIRDAYQADEPFVLEAVPSSYRQTLNGTVERSTSRRSFVASSFDPGTTSTVPKPRSPRALPRVRPRAGTDAGRRHLPRPRPGRTA